MDGKPNYISKIDRLCIAWNQFFLYVEEPHCNLYKSTCYLIFHVTFCMGTMMKRLTNICNKFSINQVIISKKEGSS